MPLILVDTNVLLRFVWPTHELHGNAMAALTSLWGAGSTLCICPQNMHEFWQVATRPVQSNGFGLAPPDVARRIDRLEANFPLLPENPSIYPEWRRIVGLTGAVGRAGFDARLAAVASTSSADAVLTYEARAFQRYADCVPRLSVIDPLTF